MSEEDAEGLLRSGLGPEECKLTRNGAGSPPWDTSLTQGRHLMAAGRNSRVRVNATDRTV